MRLIFLLMDSLNRSALGAYNGTIETPNFDRLEARSVTFDRHYVGSLPCIPARRDIQTGRASFFHRSWGPMEPYDQSVCQLLRQSGVYSHLITDHFHYFQNGGSGYHTQYDSWDFVRGQEYDTWKAIVQPPLDRFASEYDQRHYDAGKKKMRVQHMVNRLYEKTRTTFQRRAVLHLHSNFFRPTRTQTIGCCNWNYLTLMSHSMLQSAFAARVIAPGKVAFSIGRTMCP
ncbi:sulfatase-like hydrolase/transferase [Rhizobium sp. L1K21]|uniref:sulfatase-like hydrolase/transferase n=1 Tax=Rhizobium sp. L1K21 TaxID=2954933 RepID=UPI00279570DB|nr:sulfatase-like hydrolase/transferase [Rhizobium sp. L1K21]